MKYTLAQASALTSHRPDLLALLNPLELSVLHLTLTGRTPDEIALELRRSNHTLVIVRANLFSLLRVSSSLEIALLFTYSLPCLQPSNCPPPNVDSYVPSRPATPPPTPPLSKRWQPPSPPRTSSRSAPRPTPPTS